MHWDIRNKHVPAILSYLKKRTWKDKNTDISSSEETPKKEARTLEREREREKKEKSVYAKQFPRIGLKFRTVDFPRWHFEVSYGSKGLFENCLTTSHATYLSR